ncbi:SusC/RagA family TonB-linked outer membrane protein [Marinoscillum sp.]|uniref:SusC/RagA family TonB-linked outer membrane protein n=1 Tax=Marinoscillum sp. TaxID=2024838 RepID=UPI003BA9B32E
MIQTDLKMMKYLLPMLLFMCSMWSFAQDRTLSGKVTDGDTGEGLPGATILVKGTDNGTITDINGNYSITIPSWQGDAVITVSFVGFVTQEIQLNGQTQLDVTMSTDIAALEEVVVVGYGSVKKSDATGSVAVVTSKDFNKGAVNSPQELIQGKAAGVSITSNSGAPGNTSTIRIRGASSIYASNDPLIVVDGVPLNNKGIGGAPNVLSTINPNDIESFTVLKDASATAIYGSRAAGGVIIITTKRGANQKLKVDYNFTGSLYTTPNKLNVYSGDEFRELITQQYAADHDARNYLGDANTDWQDAIYKDAFGQDHNVSLSGSVPNLDYRASVGYNNTDGVLKTYNFERTTVAVGLDPTLLNDKLRMQLNVKGMINNNNFAEQGAIANAIAYNPTLPIYNGNTRYRGYTTLTDDPENVNGNPITLGTANPVAQLALTDNTSQVKRSIGNLKVNYEIIDGLIATANVGYDYAFSEGHNNVADSTQWVYLPVPEGGRTTLYENERKNELLDFYVSYKRDAESINSRFDAMVGYSWAHFSSHDTDSTWNRDQTVFQRGNDFPSEYYLISFFGRLNYTLLDKYLLTLTLRNDQTSRFGPDQRSGLFPSAAFAWNIHDEAFLKSSQLVSDLKLRLGYGVTGQQDVVNNDYPYIPTYTLSNSSARYQLGNTFYNTLRPDGYDAYLKWETTTTFNAGIDFGLFKNRLSGSLDVYQKETTDLLNQVDISPGTNFVATLITNVGDMVNRGVELNLNWIAIDQGDWRWKLNGNVFFNRNEVTKLNNSADEEYTVPEPSSSVGGTTDGTAQVYRVGYPIRSYYVYEQVYGPDGKMIPNAFVDRNKNGIIDNDDRYLLKNPNPDVIFGFNTWLSYKQFDLAINARANLNNYVYNNVAANSNYYNLYDGMGYLRNMSTQADLTQITDAGEFTRLSDYYVENGTFFRVDNVNLTYNLPDVFNEFADLSFTVGVQNALLITNYRGLDPEVSGGMDNNFYPRSRTFMLGIKASF